MSFAFPPRTFGDSWSEERFCFWFLNPPENVKDNVIPATANDKSSYNA